ncbi:MAG: outer membrane protein assembly factor, partial [Thermodesulfovibrionales bacterium]
LHERKLERSIDTREVRYRLKRTTASLGIDRRLAKEFNVEFYYDFSVVNTFDVKPDIIITREDTGTLIISALRTGFIYDTRDSPFEPTEGMLAGITAKFATSLLLSETDFAKLSFYINKYLALSKNMVFAGSLRGGIARGLKNTQELPLVERFFLGGRTTVRGYEQDMLGPKGSDGNPIGGNLFSMANLELRTNVGKGLGIVTFLDAGNVWQTTANMSTIRYTTGLGLRYNTPVGPFRIDYGYKLNRQKGESKGEIHFSLGHAF